ncbi:MAG: haloacid dehalogenase-like hydrolase [Bryobacterales bacterium]
MRSPTPRAAAFFRLEGAVVPTPAVLAAGWLAANAQHVGQRALRLGAVALTAPFALGVGDPSTGARLAWAALRGTSEDRLRVLGEEYALAHLVPRIRPVALDLVERARRDGCAIVVVSDHPEQVVTPVAEHLRADAVVANRLELRNGRATGRLCDPVVARFGGQPLRRWAVDHGVDLARSRAYGGAAEDQVLLSTIGLPCAVHPDRTLRRVARDLDWPVVEG